ncbi:hypothetical protein HELRODRAFT_160837 [Helobdella robusta]|uniref:Uncharacterized protein n=1 Tax=Helobdella robusta TaxID=6412 RepID=T1EQT0_HELRO|nr:hypothetical protein HELRODRAFT_160837 [Helobdella robusta]ESO06647.1 hypothetical protein HELRODRAFT_160837 [Helobdella robusta]
MDVMDMVNKSDNTSAVIVKTKILGLKEELDKCKEMCQSSKEELNKERSKKSQTEIEVLALREKVKSMEDQCTEINNKVQEATDKLMGVTKSRRALDHRKNMDLDRMATLEEMYKETKMLLVESERKYEEVSKKLLIVKADSDRAEARIQRAEITTKNIKDETKGLTAKLKSYQLQLEEASMHNEKVADQIHKLQTDIKYLHKTNIPLMFDFI